MTQRNYLNDDMISLMSAVNPSPRVNKMRISATRIAAVLYVMLLGISPESPCQSLVKMLSVHTPRMTAHARFGWRVDAHGDWAVISGPFEEVNGDVAAGRVYIYSAKHGWQQVQLIEAPDAQAVQTFGMAVALTDDALVVGAPGDHEGALMSGAVYIYTRNASTWEFSAKILSPESIMGGRFGGAVDLSPHVLVVGAHRAFGSAEKSGSVYVFERDTASWRFVKELYPKIIIPDEAFGTSVQLLDDSTIAVGRSMSDPLEGRKEAVSIFSRRGGIWLQQDLTVPTEGGVDLFGLVLASNDRYIAVGVPGRTVGGIRCGSVFIYDRMTLLPLQIINNPKTPELIYFGGSLSMTDNRLYVSSVQTGGEERKPMGKIASYKISTLDFELTQWYSLDDQEGLPHTCPQVSATDSVLLASSPFSDVDGIVDGGMARFFPVSGAGNDEKPSVPFEYALDQNYPNPFNAITRINYSLKAPGRIRLEMYNILGQHVATLVNKDLMEGNYFVSFDAKHFATGVYFYRISVNEFVAVKKMLLLK
jgi:hypothetical protein